MLGFFRGHPVVEDSIEFVRRADGKMTGEVYVRLPSAEDAKRAMALDRSLMGRRYVELFISGVEEYSKVTSAGR